MRIPGKTLVFALAAACPPASAAPRPINVILVVVDTLGAGHLGTYGYARATDPRLKRLAASGPVFLNTIAQSDWTLSSLASIMTGLYPSVHGAMLPTLDENFGSDLGAGRYHPRAGERLEPSRPTLAAVLAHGGYKTAGFISGGFPNSIFGFGAGFDEYHNGGGRMEQLSAAYLSWIEKHRREKFFIYIHVNDVHDPYQAPPPYNSMRTRPYKGKLDGSREANDALDDAVAAGRPPSAEDLDHLRSLYDGGISYTDEHIGRLLDRLKEWGLDRNTAVIVTADHGEAFLEHGYLRHTNAFYDEVIQVPLLAVFPGLKKGQRLGGQARLIDIMPTILDYVGLPAPPMQGRSLLPWLRGAPVEDREAFSESFAGAALRTRDRKLIVYPGRSDGYYDPSAEAEERHNYGPRPDELYDLTRDAAEKHNLQADRRKDRRAMLVRLAAWRAEMARAASALPPLPASEKPVIDADLREKLRAGGYLK